MSLTSSAGRPRIARTSYLEVTAWEQLGVTRADTERTPQITPQLRAISHTIRRQDQPRVRRRVRTLKGSLMSLVTDTEQRAPYGPGADVHLSWPVYLHQSDAPEARAVLDKYYTLPKNLARLLPIEAFCLAAQVSPLRIVEILAATLVRLGAQASSVIAAVNHPRVVAKTVEMALTDEGHEDRADLHRATGFLPLPKGAQTVVNVQAQASAGAQAQAAAPIVAPAPEQTIRRLADRFNDVRYLPTPVTPASLPEVRPFDLVSSSTGAPAGVEIEAAPAALAAPDAFAEDEELLDSDEP